jgi:hypothetical protein
MTERTPDKIGSFDPAPLLQPPAYDPGMKRPTSTAAGAALVLLRALAGVASLVLIATNLPALSRQITVEVDGLTPDLVQTGLVVVAVVSAVAALLDAVFAFLIYRGMNWPRVVVMSFTVISITSSFVAWWWQGQSITLANNTLLSLGLDILILLALSSRASSAFARRNQRR